MLLPSSKRPKRLDNLTEKEIGLLMNVNIPNTWRTGAGAGVGRGWGVEIARMNARR